MDKLEKWRGYIPDDEIEAYRKGAFGRKIGYGARPALLNIDTTRMFVDPEFPQCGREMPELIEGGYLYIAQPPLFKVMRGKSEVYLKDQTALEDYLIDQGTDGAALRLKSGEDITGNDLVRVVEEARQTKRILDAFPTHYPRHILEQAAIAGALNSLSNPMENLDQGGALMGLPGSVFEGMSRGFISIVNLFPDTANWLGADIP